MAFSVAVALGSNLGDRTSHLDWAVSRLRDSLDGLVVSPWFETEPVGSSTSGQDLYLNGALIGATALSPRALLDTMLIIERERGRERPYRWAPRTLDLDLILYADRIVDEPGLRVPHPRFRERRFVLEPLSLIAGDWRDPESGLTIQDLYVRLIG